MKTSKLLNTKEISRLYEISRSTLSRWVARGCPHQIIESRHYFNSELVNPWLKINLDQTKSTPCLKSLRKLKRYEAFTKSGNFHSTVFGCKNLQAVLKTMEPDDSLYPYGVDIDGYVFFFYSGKLRKHESVKTFAGVLISNIYPEKLEPLMQIVRQRYLHPSQYR